MKIHINNTLIGEVAQCGKPLNGLRHADIETVKGHLLTAPLCNSCVKRSPSVRPHKQHMLPDMTKYTLDGLQELRNMADREIEICGYAEANF